MTKKFKPNLKLTYKSKVLFLSFGHLNFEFVSNFVLRISILTEVI